MVRSTLLKLSESKSFARWVTSNKTTRRMSHRFVAGEALDEAISAARHDPAWVRKARQDAWAIYEKTPMPTTNDELWRRTDISSLKLNRLQAAFEAVPAATSAEALPEGLKRLLDVGDAEAAGYVAQYDGSPMFVRYCCCSVVSGTEGVCMPIS